MKQLLATAAVLIALADVAGAQPAATQMGQHLVYRTQMIRDRIGIQCQRLRPAGRERDECEASAFTPYHSIVDSIRKAERNGGDEALNLISKMIDEFEAKVAPLMQSMKQ